MTRLTRTLALAAALAAVSGSAQAQYSQTLPEFSGPFEPAPYPAGPFTVGTFTGLPGGTILTAQINGTFGNSVATTTAPLRVFLGSLQVAQCTDVEPCFDNGPVPWSFVLSPADFGVLAGGSVDLTVLQDNDTYIRLGETTLTIRTLAAVPEPATVVLSATGLALIGLVARRRRAG